MGSTKGCALLIAFVLFGALLCEAQADEVQNGGRTKFEIFGMMNEYKMRFGGFDGETIQSFDSREAAAAACFEELLAAYCKEEDVSPGFIIKAGTNGSVSFVSPAIANSIWSHYDKGELGAGDLKKSELVDASDVDLLRYLRGFYFRNKYHDSEVIHAINASWEMHHAGTILSNMGCTGVRIYTTETIPNVFVLIFSPTPKIRGFLGIKNTVMLDDLEYKFGNRLKLFEQIGND